MGDSTPRTDVERDETRRPEGVETPGDTEAPDIVSRTGEEMPEASHDEVRRPPREEERT